MAEAKSEFRTAWTIVLPLTVLFAILAYLGILHHEMWLDETHHWLLAKDSGSLSELFFNARYEGHPMLWNILLFALTRFTSSLFAMQVLNLCISIFGVFLFLRRAPFSLLIKILVVFSYFIFYEYTQLARNYSLAFLLLVIVCILFKERRKHFLRLSIVLFILAQAHLFAAIIAEGIFFLLIYEKFSVGKVAGEKFYQNYFAGIVLMLISMALVIWQVIPPSDHFLYSYDHDSLLSFKRIGKGLSVLFKGLFPIPDFTNGHPWNSNLIVNFSKSLAVIPAALAWFIPCILLRRNKGVLFFFYFTAICLAFFIYYSPLIVASRHCGFFFLLLIVAMWLVTYYPESTVPEGRLKKTYQPILFSILIIQLISGIYLYVVDWNRPFSNGKAVAEWCKNNTVDSEIILVNDHSAGPPVSAYLGRKVYYAENNSFGSFCKWNTKPFIISQDTLLSRVYRLLKQSPGNKLILVLNRPLRWELSSIKPDPDLRVTIEEKQDFGNALVRSEDYTIYEITKVNL